MNSLLAGETARALRPGEEDEFLGVLCAAFGLDFHAARPLFRADPFFDLSHKRALWTADGQMASVLTVIPCPLRVGGNVVPVGGIAGVATRADRRGQGCASRLLSATVAACDAELPYSALALFAVQRDFYRHRGWADASRLWVWTGESPAPPAPNNGEAGVLAPSLLPRMGAGGPPPPFPAVGVPQGGTGTPIAARPAAPADRSALHALHARLTEQRTGACVRDSRRWHIIETLAPGRQTWVFADRDNAVRGYALVDRMDDAEDAYRVVELLADGEDARRAARAFLDAPPFPVSRWEWPAAPSDFAALGLHTDISPEHGMMLKLCSPARALAMRHADGYRPYLTGGRSLTLQTDRESLLLNERGVHVGQGGDDCISCSSPTLAQLFMGYYSAAEAAQLGLLSASSPDALALAERLFPAFNPCVLPADQF